MRALLRAFALPALSLAALFPVALQPAFAQEDAPRHNNPVGSDTEVSAPVAFVQDYEPDPAMWRLADDDTTLYFLGTFHVLPEGFRWRSPLIERVIGEADEIVFESRSEDEDSIDFAAIFGGSAEQILSRTPVSQQLSDENVPKWRKLAELMDLPYFVLDRMPPTLTMLFVGVTATEMQGSSGDYGVETILESEFEAAGKPISAIEDPVAVMRNVLALDEALAIETLETMLSEWDGEALVHFEDGEAQADWDMEHNWARGQLDLESFEDWMDDPFSQGLYQILLVDRNRAWADWIIERLDRPGTVMIAVGAGHFEGPDAVQEILAQRGFAVERLNPSSPVVPVAEDSVSEMAE